MRKLLLLSLVFFPAYLLAQFGVKAGVNFANVTKASSINNSSRSGYTIGVLMGSPGKKIIGFRPELSYSKQGYDYKTSTNTGFVNLDYIMSTNLTTINISKYFQLQAGFQAAYLISAKVDSSTGSGSSNPYSKILDLYNRIDYGVAGGIEIHPVSNLLIGARVNISLGNLYKMPEPGQQPSFIPAINVKNNLFQIYAGWRFAKQSSASKKKES